MNIKNIVLSEQYKGILPRPTAEEYEALKQSIREEGIKMSLMVNGKNVLLDGYTRYQIAAELRLNELPTEIKEFASEAEERAFIVSVNLHRRHLNTAQKAEIGLMLLEAEKERAKERMLTGKKIYPDQNSDRGRALQIAAQKVGISHDTLNKARQIKEAAKENDTVAETWNKALEGKTTFNRVYAHTLREEKRKLIALTTPPKGLAPTPTGDRKVTAVRWTHKKTGEVMYELRIGPNETGCNIQSLYEQTLKEPEFQEWKTEIKELQEKAESLRQEAAEAEELARRLYEAMRREIKSQIEFEHGPIEPFIETFDIEVLDQELNAQLNKLGKPEAEQIAALLLSLWDTGKFKIKDPGMWGDIMFWDFKSSGQYNRPAEGWHRIGSMDQVKD